MGRIIRDTDERKEPERAQGSRDVPRSVADRRVLPGDENAVGGPTDLSLDAQADQGTLCPVLSGLSLGTHVGMYGQREGDRGDTGEDQGVLERARGVRV